MKGTYNIRWCPDRCDRWHRSWSTFVKLCRSLHHQELHYKVLIIKEDGSYSLRINAWGIPVVKRTRKSSSARVKVKVPAPLTEKRCSRELREAQATLNMLRQEMKSAARLNNPYHYPRGRYELTPRDHILYKINRNRRLGKWLAHRISAKGRTLISYSLSRSDYVELDAICRFRVNRLSKLYAHTRDKVQAFARHQDKGIVKAYVLIVLCDSSWFNSKTRWEAQCDRCKITPIDLIGYDKARAEVQHWTEMLRLVIKKAKERK